MSLTTERSNRNSGFSLVEVLAALAIAAALTGALLQTFSVTRYNASRIGELIDMMTLSDNLIAQMSSERIQTTKIDGHEGKFTWHFEIKPDTYSVNIIQYGQNAQPDQPKDGKNPNDALQIERLGSRPRIGDSKWTNTRFGADRIAGSQG